jgi:microcystin-dependent protein
MSEPFIGEIKMFAGNFAPRGYALCDGQLLSINQYQALFSILGTTYGGDGRTTFALPDLRGRLPIHPGTGPGLSNRRLGEKGGHEAFKLASNTLPGSKKPGTTIYTNQANTENNMPPYLGINYIIALEGLYPSRS